MTGCKKEEQITLRPVTLEYWGVDEDEEALQAIITEYREKRPHVQINYRKFNKDEYEEELLEALAQEEGPDIISVPNVKLRNYLTKITYLPETMQVQELSDQGVPVNVTKQAISFNKARNDYLDFIYDTIVKEGQRQEGVRGPVPDQIVGIPLHIDTMVLYYNKDMLDAAQITDAPRTWFQFQDAVKALTRVDDNNNIVQSGAALGTSNNVNYMTDILAALILQSGGLMTNETMTRVYFNEVPPGGDFGFPPAYTAFQFYMDFASTVKDSYTWNKKMPNSLEAFIQGRVAFYLGFYEDYENIKDKNPKLNFKVSSLPQIQGNLNANVARFNLISVSNKSMNTAQAWDFIQYLTSIENLSLYLEEAKKPTPLRALINSQTQDELLKPFAEQLLTVKLWYEGYDYDKVEDIFAQLIDDLTEQRYQNDIEAVENAARQVQGTMYKN